MVTEKSLPKIAYFSMEIALDPSIPSYGGGLGILAGDMLRSAADLELPMVAMTLAHRKGYFRQRLDAEGNQTEEPDPWEPEAVLTPVDVNLRFASRIATCTCAHGATASMECPDSSSPSICWIPTCRKIPNRTARLPTLSTAAISATASARKCCWALAAWRCCAI